MVQINFKKKQITVKIVLAGPPSAGKTTTLEALHKVVPGDHDAIQTLTTEGDPTLTCVFRPRGFLFDPGPPPANAVEKPLPTSTPEPSPRSFMDNVRRFTRWLLFPPEPPPRSTSAPPREGCSVRTGKVGGMDTTFEVTTVPGKPWYNATKKLALMGVDGVVFVADSDPERLEANVAELELLEEFLAEVGLGLQHTALVMQWNKRDLDRALPIERLEEALNRYDAPSFETSALTASGVDKVLARVGGGVLAKLNKEYCSCTFDPDRVRRFEDVVLEANLATGVTHAVLAGESRPTR